jgi:hypothetical protein
MASKTVKDAVAARAASVWPHTPIRVTNTTAAVPEDLGAFLIVQFHAADENQITIGQPGNNKFREQGGIRFILCIPIGSGTDPWDARIDQLRSDFRAKQFGTPTVTTWAASPPVDNDQSDYESYFEIAFVVPYFFDLVG